MSQKLSKNRQRVSSDLSHISSEIFKNRKIFKNMQNIEFFRKTAKYLKQSNKNPNSSDEVYLHTKQTLKRQFKSNSNQTASKKILNLKKRKIDK